MALHLMAVLNSGVQRSRLLQARAHCATVLDHAGTDELTHLFGSTRRPQDGKPTPRERRQQFADEGLQNRSAAAVRAYSTSNSTYGSGRTFDEYPPRHLATTARWDSCQAMCTSAHQACVVCGDQLARPADCPRLWSWPKLCGRSQRARSDACEPWQLHSRGAIECWRERGDGSISVASSHAFHVCRSSRDSSRTSSRTSSRQSHVLLVAAREVDALTYILPYADSISVLSCLCTTTTIQC